MSILKSNDINIVDLPDELLLIIFNKLYTTDIFYSLIGVNQRFDRLALDSLNIHHLDFVIERSDINNSSMYVDILGKICSKILPRIIEKVTKLTIDPLSMKCILTNVHYPQLHSLSLINFQPDIYLHLLSGGIIYRLLNNQITHLIIDIGMEKEKITDGTDPATFIFILRFAKYLIDLTFSQQSSGHYLMFSSSNIPYIPRGSCLSSTLIKLTIKMETFDDCLLLLNGCLPSLLTLIIRITIITCSSRKKINSTEKLVKLKSFSLTTSRYTYFYHKRVVPLLRRMLNLEELALQLSVMAESTYIDGNQLYDEVLSYMPQLKKFIFNIHTCIMNRSIEINLPSNNEIRKSFINKGFQSIGTCVDEKLVNKIGNCHVYSLPYQFSEFLFMTSCFQGGNKFDKVRMLLMFDRRPFEHELFNIISQDFPFLQKLIILNFQAQKNKQQHSSTLITFNHLFKLHLSYAHIDYAIQFLSNKNTHLPCLTILEIPSDTLMSVTSNFTNDATRHNCDKIKTLITTDRILSENFDSYFSSH